MNGKTIKRPCWFCRQGLDQCCLNPRQGEALGKSGQTETHRYTCQGHRLGHNIIGVALRAYVARKPQRHPNTH